MGAEYDMSRVNVSMLRQICPGRSIVYVRIPCYMQERVMGPGRVLVTLHARMNDERIMVTGDDSDKEAFLKFLTYAHYNRSMLEDAFDWDGNMSAVIYGVIATRTSEGLVLRLDFPGCGFGFE